MSGGSAPVPHLSCIHLQDDLLQWLQPPALLNPAGCSRRLRQPMKFDAKLTIIWCKTDNPHERANCLGYARRQHATLIQRVAVRHAPDAMLPADLYTTCGGDTASSMPSRLRLSMTTASCISPRACRHNSTQHNTHVSWLGTPSVLGAMVGPAYHCYAPPPKHCC